MLTVLKAIPWQALLLVAVATVLWFAGYHAGSARYQHLRDMDQLTAFAAANKQLVANMAKELQYEQQLRQVSAQALANRRELDRLRSAPHPRILCHQAPSDTVSGSTASPSGGAAGDGSLSQAIESDPTDALFKLADEADDAIETARNALAQWPK